MPEETIFKGSNNSTKEVNPVEEVVKPKESSAQSSPPAPKDNGKRSFVKIFGLAFLIVTIFLAIFTLLTPRVNKSQSRSVTLSYWGFWEESTVTPIISDFEKENPNVKVIYTKEDPKDYREKLTTRFGNENGPDIFRFHNTWYPMFANDLLPLPKETIEKQEFSDSFYPAPQQDLIKNGAIYGIPLEIDTLALYINQQIFDSVSTDSASIINPPTTWQEFIDSSQKLTKRDENGKISISGAAMGIFENVDHAPDIISLLFAQNGVNFENFDKSGAKVSDALRFYTNFAQVEDSVWDPSLDNSLLAFSQGKLAMFFGYASDYSKIKSSNPNLLFKIVPVPQLLKDKKINFASYWAEGISSKSKNQKEALLFMKFLAKKETGEKLYSQESKTGFGEPYANKNSAEKLKNTDAFVFVDQAKTAVSSPFVDGTYDNGLNDKLGGFLKDSVNSILSGTSEDTSAESLFQGYSQVFSQYSPSAN